MGVAESVAYLKGLIEGLDLGDDKQSKAIRAIVTVLEEMSTSIEDINVDIDELNDAVDSIDEDLETLENVYLDEDEDPDDAEEDDDGYMDEELYEVVCPTCGETICVDEEMLDDGEMKCPNCGEHLEFDLDVDDCGCGCEECGGCGEEDK